MLYPHRHGEELPKTTWEAENKLQVSFKNQMELYTFSKLENGQPAFELTQTAGIGRGDRTFRLGHKVDELEGILEDDKETDSILDEF